MLRPLLVLTLLAIVAPAQVQAQSIVVQPYLQHATHTSIKILWESDTDGASTVDWGLSAATTLVSTVTSQVGNGDSRIHTAELTGLLPGTRYYYRVHTGAASSATYDFVVPADPASEESFRIVAMSDMQRDGGNPDIFRQVVEDGVIGFVQDEFSDDIPAEVALTMIPGDLVSTGPDYGSWASTFFTPSEALNRHVPLYPVPGNHEADTEFFFRYFDLPMNGTAGFEEHWWFLDHGNLRLIGLDSNPGYRVPTQLAWLDGVLTEACSDPTIDFVFAQLHHPFKSELWIAGELDYTGDVVSRLETFSTNCGKPSIHFFGHTHGYSRGQSQDHQHLWVNVATAGGNIDYWGEYAQVDYDEFTVSEDEYGFVLVEVNAGNDPRFRLRRVTRGDENNTRDNVVSDDVTIRTNNTAPTTPQALSPAAADEPVAPEGVLLVASLYEDVDDEHGGSQFQVAANCAFSAPLLDSWVQHQNWYFGQDTQAGDDLADLFVERLPGDADLCWRIRYRDRGLVWSDWSEGASFRTAPSVLGANLLVNPGAEEETTGWTARLGVIESLAAGECNAGNPHTGDHYFAVGGVCAGEADEGEAFQSVDVGAHRDAIDGGRATAHYGGFFADWGGDDVPGALLIFRDAKGFEVSRAPAISSATTTWTEVSDSIVVPDTTASIEYVMTGTRNAGADNDSYLDDLSLHLEVTPEGDDDDAAGDDDSASDDDDDAVDDDDSAGVEDGCGCDGGGAAMLLFVVPGMRLRRLR
jgi:acid phosphatase type 7